MCGASGASVDASARELGAEIRHGAENSALKNIAPFNRTPLRTSENASICLRTPGKLPWPPGKTLQRRRTAGQGLQPHGHGQAGQAPRRIIHMNAKSIVETFERDAALDEGAGERFSG